jgi:large subunit ribosomal protein L9
MKLLLHADIEKLGYFGDVVEVNESYARNYLLPQRKGVVPNEQNVKAIEDERAARVEERRLVREALVQAAEKVNGAEITIEVLANDLGHLFGSVSEADIAKALCDKGFDVQSKHVVIQQHVRELGETEIRLHFTEEVDATIKLNVIGPEGQKDDGSDTEPVEPVEPDEPDEPFEPWE